MFLKVFKIKSVHSVYALMVFKFFCCVGITICWPTLLRVVNNRACLYKICLHYSWSKVLGTRTVVYISSVEDRLRPPSLCLVPRELLPWSPITFVHTGYLEWPHSWETLFPRNLILGIFNPFLGSELYSLKEIDMPTTTAALLWRKRKITSWLASLKTLTNFKNPSSNPLQRACCGIQKSLETTGACRESTDLIL